MSSVSYGVASASGMRNDQGCSRAREDASIKVDYHRRGPLRHAYAPFRQELRTDLQSLGLYAVQPDRDVQNGRGRIATAPLASCILHAGLVDLDLDLDLDLDRALVRTGDWGLLEVTGVGQSRNPSLSSGPVGLDFGPSRDKPPLPGHVLTGEAQRKHGFHARHSQFSHESTFSQKPGGRALPLLPQ
ncbi:hypothetical protein N7462_004518 [Penicillium macrosclerotiorum]|uniref:uncharacterized protein n=1 Tax=Penicillium macrosclerotiorum TaxID=303699 RepID=UPI00254797C8|nr:uncharacterized protein N7462_004518 [Penicillium macrosclerotiorum]KAJ5690126.1 hypothetical protein N7462_004518 [Penicillium macrosclerotiorum]